MLILRPPFRYLPVIVASVLVVSVALGTRICADELAVTERRLLADASDESLDDLSLLEGALIASGVTDWRRVERYCREFTQRIEEVAPAGDNASTVTADAERVYRFLHREFLAGEYHRTCTEIERALDDGDYNCVTATILYHCICRVRGLSPIAVATNTHVRSRFLNGPLFDVETTCPEWFDIVRRDPPSQTYRTQRQVTRPLTDIQLLAKIYYNRGVSQLETRDFGKAIALLRLSQSLDPADLPTRENMAAGFNNWGLAESDAGNFERAVELLQQAREQHPELAALAANDVHIHQRWAVTLCEQGRFAEAMQALRAAHLRRPEVPLFDRGRLAVFGQWAASLLESGEFEVTLQLFEDAGGWFEDASEISRYRSIAIQTAVERLAHAGRHDRANRLVRWGLELDPADPQLQEAARRLTMANL